VGAGSVEAHRECGVIAESGESGFVDVLALIKPQGPWHTVEQGEIATLEWVDWYLRLGLLPSAVQCAGRPFSQPLLVRNRVLSHRWSAFEPSARIALMNGSSREL